MELRHALIAAAVLALAACGGGPVKRVSEPAAGIQQLTVRADGRWDVVVRLDNFSSVPMRFAERQLRHRLRQRRGGESVQAQPGISIGPESADVFTVDADAAARGSGAAGQRSGGWPGTELHAGRHRGRRARRTASRAVTRSSARARWRRSRPAGRAALRMRRAVSGRGISGQTIRRSMLAFPRADRRPVHDW
jgi:hypothetical protein